MIKVLGWLLLAGSLGSLALFLYAAIIVRVLPAPSKDSSPVLWAIREDEYYHLLVPVTVPVAVIAVYLNWFSINLFKSS
jgi:phosphatidylinositol glycan anchor class Y biosynthesis protein